MGVYTNAIRGLQVQPVFSARTISRAMRAGDSHRYGVDVFADGPGIAEQLSGDIVSRIVSLAHFRAGRARGKDCVTYPDYGRSLTLRVLATYIAKRFRITPPNRDRIVSGVVEAMMDATPYTVIRRDVRSFYESINAGALRERLIYDTSLPRIVRHFLTQYFDTHCPPGQAGLPRGVGLSGILAELAMEHFDRRIRSLPGVYRYFRYSDDIVVFCYDRAPSIEQEMEQAIPTGMTFHRTKRAAVSFADKGRAERCLDYLGYRFSTENGTGARTPRTIEVSISPDKIKRVKTRVILSLKSYKKHGDTSLLIDRMKLLSSNYQLQRHGVSFWGARKRVRSGIYYNYRRCGLYAGSEFTPKCPSSLSSLDNFTHHLLRSPHSEFHTRLRAEMNTHQWRQLGKVSFRLGFQSKRLVRQSYARLAQVRKAWRNA